MIIITVIIIIIILISLWRSGGNWDSEATQEDLNKGKQKLEDMVTRLKENRSGVLHRTCYFRLNVLKLMLAW